MATKSQRANTRDRAATTMRILDAVETILTRDGFPALGVNSIAREAGVDKVLIYRYFGGQTELVREFILTRDVWPDREEFLDGIDLEKLKGKRLHDRFAAVLLNGEKALLRRPLSLALIHWELVAPDEVAEFTRVREQTMLPLVADVSAGATAGSDAEALFALLWSGMIYQASLARAGSPLLGIRPRKKPERKRIESQLKKIIQKVLKGKKKNPKPKTRTTAAMPIEY